MCFKKGYTLIELLVYLAILAVFSVFIVNSILIIMKNYNAYSVSRYVNFSATVAIERLTREIRGSSDVDGSSVLGAHPGYLVLDAVEFFVSNNQLMIDKNGQGAVVLTPSNLEVTNLVFATSTNPNSQVVKIEMTLTGRRGNYEKSENFYSTIVLRGSYE